MFKRILKWSALAFALFLAYFFYQLLMPAGPITVSPQTTVITEPLADDGLPDYSKYLLDKMGEGVTPENNGAIPFLQAMWPAGLDAQEHSVICNELGMEVPASNGLAGPYGDNTLRDQIAEWLAERYSGEQHDNARETLSSDLIDYAGEQPWRSEDLPPLANWLAAHNSHFDLLHEAASREKYYLPSYTLLTDPKASHVILMLPHIQTLRSAVRSLRIRAYYNMGSGDLPAAWRDCRAMYQLSDTCKREYLVCELVSIACEHMAHYTMRNLLDSDELSEQLASEIHDYLASRPPRHNMRHCINESERLTFVTSVLEMSGNRRPEESSMGDFGALTTIANRLAIDWSLVLEKGNDYYDRLDAALALATVAERQTAIDAVIADITKQTTMAPGKLARSALSRNARSKSIANILAALLVPAVDAAINAEYRANGLLLLHQTAAELALYRTTHGEYPDSLDKLASHESALRLDPFGNALVYKPFDNGYLLYTLGPNGQDEGGSHGDSKIYQGYEEADSEEADKALRAAIGKAAYEPKFEGDYEMLRPPKGSDDLALRLPLLKKRLPRFEAAAE